MHSDDDEGIPRMRPIPHEGMGEVTPMSKIKWGGEMEVQIIPKIHISSPPNEVVPYHKSLPKNIIWVMIQNRGLEKMERVERSLFNFKEDLIGWGLDFI